MIKKKNLGNLPANSGIYQMFDKDGKVIYVGKAKNLKRRLASYFRVTSVSLKTNALMQHVADIKVIVTTTENEALLLENTLIKRLKPKYNIVFKDDKSYPYLHISAHQFPRLSLQRETKNFSGHYYGPYPNTNAAHEVLNILQKNFKLRSCKDGFFRNRTRPCVQYQIKRCSAPCVGYIAADVYQLQVNMVAEFLQGKSAKVRQKIKDKMQQEALQLDYEAAAYYRDQIQNLQKVCEQQYVYGKSGNVDVIAVVIDGQICMQILFIRNGKIVGSKSYFPKGYKIISEEEALGTFLTQYYLSTMRQYTTPTRILVNIKLVDRAWIESAISEQLSRKITLADNVRGTNRRWLKMAEANAKHALAIRRADKNDFAVGLQELQTAFQLPNLPKRIECFDVSHTMGAATVASCVVFDQTGPVKAEYRRFNIKNITKGDDYAAIEQVLQRRYQSNKFPDVVIIDGGKGQLARAKTVLPAKSVNLLAIAKGSTRKPGLEVIYTLTAKEPIVLAKDSVVLHLLQRIRDEAHRFAITGHRHQRAKTSITSTLENIPGIGSQKRKELLKCFKGLQELMKVSVEDLAKVPGISILLARRIYNVLHNQEIDK